MINFWCNLHPRKKTLKRESSATRRVPTLLRRRKGPPVWRDPSATLEHDASGSSRERSQEVSSLGKNSDGEALQNIINKLLDIRNLKDLHLKHCHVSFAQFKKRTTHLDISRMVYDLHEHVVKTCPFSNSTKPRPDRSRVHGEQKNLEISSSWIMVRQKLEIKLLESDCFGWCYFALHSISM